MRQLGVSLEPGTAPPARQSSEGVLAWPLVMAAVGLALAIQVQDGEYTPVAMGLVTIALLATLAAVVRPWPRELQERLADGAGDSISLYLLATLLAVQFGFLLTTWPGVDLPRRGGLQLLPFWIGLGLALLQLLAGLGIRRAGFVRWWFPALLFVHLGLGIWMVTSATNPHIDVWVFQQGAAGELLKGHNPYAMTFPDIYHSTMPGRQAVYGPGLVADDRCQFGFPYPPVSLLMSTIGYAIAGDHRYAQAVALTVAGGFIGYSAPGQIAKLAAALLLFTPRTFFVLGRGWTEPFGVMLLAATIFCAGRGATTWLPVALGLLLATKQYMIFAVPLTFFLVPGPRRWRDWIDLLWKSALVAAAVTLPLAIWNWSAFWRSTVTVQELSPFRWDALSYLVWYGFRGHLVTEPITAAFWSSLAALTMLGLSLWRAPRNPAGFAASLALICLAFFAFNKQAFCNYYFFVIGALCCAIAASAAPFAGERTQKVRPA